MTSEASLHPNAILKLNYPALSAHFIDLIGTQPTSEHVNTINARLLDLIHGESLPPNVYKIWLPVALKHSPHLLSQALRDPVSHYVREIGIRQLARISRSPSWKSRGWEILGNAEGIRGIVQDLSINEVLGLLGAIARSIHRPEESLPTHVEKLFHCLHQEKSSRSLRRHLDILLPLCGSSFVENVLSSLPETRVSPQLVMKIAQRHPALLRRIATGQATVPNHVQKKVTKSCVSAMVRSLTPYTAVWFEPGSTSLLSGVCFTVDLLHMMAQKDASMKLEPYSIQPYIYESLRHICRQKASFHHIYFLLAKALPLIAVDNLKALNELPFAELIRCWSIAGFGTATQMNSPLEKLPHPQHPSRPSADHKDLLEGLVIGVLEQCPVNLPNSRDASLFHIIQQVFKKIAAPARLPFLKLLCRHSDLEIDLDLPPSEKEKKVFAIWPSKMMELLPAADIRQLFDRMLLIHGSTEYIVVVDGENSILSWSSQCQLKTRCEAAVAITDDDFPMTTAGISEMRKRAEKGKDPALRLHWASKAVKTALVSGSLGLFHEAIQWSTRFMRDNVVFPSLMETDLLGSSSSSLLGCAEALSTGELYALQDQIGKANGILIEILTILKKASKETLDSFRMTGRIRDSLANIVTHRARAVHHCYNRALSSEPHLATLLLHPLIEIFLKYDQAAIELGWWRKNTLLLSGFKHEEYDSSIFLSFMDKLVQARDEYWKAEHAKERPDTKERIGFPQGLAVQHLIPSEMVPFALENPDRAPYSATRLHAVLFGPVDILMATVSRSGLRYDMEVDGLEDIISSYLSHCSRKDKTDRLLRVWKYYATVLEPFPDHLNIFRRWMTNYAEAREMEKVNRIVKPVSIPKYPDLDQYSGSDVVTWNPCKQFKQNDQITTPLTVLYCRMQGEVPSNDVVTEKVEGDPGPTQILAADTEQIIQSKSLRESESIVLLSLLFLGTLTNRPLLNEIFPNPEAGRWPPLVLEGVFVSIANIQVHNLGKKATNAIKDGIALVPTHVLSHLITSLMEGLPPVSTPTYRMLFRCVVSLTKLLPLTDQPELGVDIVLQIIKHFSDDSEYHRHLRLTQLGQALDPRHAVILMQSLADFVCERLRNPSAFVKITTVKMVVQLVAAAEFIPTAKSLSILQSIYSASSHIDVQTEVVSSVLSLLERDFEHADNLFSFLYKLAMSTVGPNGNDQSSKWARAEQDGILPDISDLCSQRLLELFTLTAFHKLPESDRGRYVQEILLPMVNESTLQHNRWMRIFLKDFDLTADDFGIDFGPFVPDTLDLVLNTWHNYMPASFLPHHRSSVLSYTAHPSFETINSCISASPKASSLEYAWAFQHWTELLSFYRNANPFYHLNVLLSRELQPILSDNTGITDESICPEYRYRAGVVARSPVKFDRASGERIVSNITLVNGLTGLRRPRDNPGKSRDRYKLLNTLMHDIVDDIEKLRSESKDEALSAKLPSRIQLQAKLLPSPHVNPLVENPLGAFTDGVLGLIRQCTEPLTVFESHHIEDMMGSVGNDLIMPLVSKLGGQLDMNDCGTSTCLTVKIVAKLLSKVKKMDIQANDEVMRMLKQWKGSQNEYVSRVAWEIDG